MRMKGWMLDAGSGRCWMLDGWSIAMGLSVNGRSKEWSRSVGNEMQAEVRGGEGKKSKEGKENRMVRGAR